MSPADADMQAIPDPASRMQLPWKPEVGRLAADLWIAGQPVAQSPRTVLKRRIAAAADPYLPQAGLLVAGLDGLRTKADPGLPLEVNMYTDGGAVDARRLPLNLLDAPRAFEANGPLRAALGEEFSAAYARLKYRDWEAYARHLSAWEMETTLDV